MPVRINRGKVYRRMAIIIQAFHNSTNDEERENIYINFSLLFDCVQRYYVELEKYKNFHSISIADRHKRVALTMKLLSRVKPIQYKESGNALSKKKILINEVFAIIVGISHLDVELSNLSEGYLKDLLYILRFENHDLKVFASKIYLLEKSLNKEFP